MNVSRRERFGLLDALGWGRRPVVWGGLVLAGGGTSHEQNWAMERRVKGQGRRCGEGADEKEDGSCCRVFVTGRDVGGAWKCTGTPLKIEAETPGGHGRKGGMEGGRSI